MLRLKFLDERDWGLIAGFFLALLAALLLAGALGLAVRVFLVLSGLR